jgi:hypothetical protein
MPFCGDADGINAVPVEPLRLPNPCEMDFVICDGFREEIKVGKDPPDFDLRGGAEVASCEAPMACGEVLVV